MKNLFFIISLFFSMNVVGQDDQKQYFIIDSGTNKKIQFTIFREEARNALKSIKPPANDVIIKSNEVINKYKNVKPVASSDEEFISDFYYTRNNHISYAYFLMGEHYRAIVNINEAVVSYDLAYENNELNKNYGNIGYLKLKSSISALAGINYYKLNNYTNSIKYLSVYIEIWKSKKIKNSILGIEAVYPLVNSLRETKKFVKAFEVFKLYLDAEIERTKIDYSHYSFVISEMARIALTFDPKLSYEYCLKGLDFTNKMRAGDKRNLLLYQSLHQTKAFAHIAQHNSLEGEKDLSLSADYSKLLQQDGREDEIRRMEISIILPLIASLRKIKDSKTVVEIYKYYLDEEIKITQTKYGYYAFIISIIAREAGKYDPRLSVEYCEKGLSYAKEFDIKGKNNISLFTSLYQIRALAYFKLNNDRAAEKDLSLSMKYLTLDENNGNKDQFFYSSCFSVMYETNKYKLIKKYISRALKYQLNNFGEGNRYYLDLLAYKRWGLEGMGESYEKVLDLSLKDAKLIKKYSGSDSEDLYLIYEEIAGYYLIILNWTKGLEYAREAAKIALINDNINLLTKLEAQLKYAKFSSFTQQDSELNKAAQKYFALYNTLNSKQLNSIDKNEHVRLSVNYIDSLIRRGNYPDVNKYFNQINSWIQKNDDDNAGYKLILKRIQASMLQSVGNHHDTKLLLENAVEKWVEDEEFFNEDYNICLLILGVASAEVGDVVKAKKCIDKFLINLKKDSDKYSAKIEEPMDLMLNAYLDMRAGDLTKNANKYIKNFDKAVKNLENTIDLSSFYMMQGLLLYENKKYRSAEKIIESVYRKQKTAKDRSYILELGSLDVLIGINKNLKRDNTKFAKEKIDALIKLSTDIFNFASDTELLDAKSQIDPYRNLVNTTDPQILFDISLKYKDFIFDNVVFNAKYLRNTNDNELRQLNEQLENLNAVSSLNVLSLIQKSSESENNDTLGKRDLEIKIKQRLKELGFNRANNDTSYKDIQDVLLENQCLIEFFSYSDSFARPNAKTDKTYCAFFITKGISPKIIELGSKKEIDGLITNYLSGKTNTNINYDALLNKLYNRLLGKIGLDQFENKIDLIYLSLDGQINLVNFNTLLTNTGEFLIEKYRLIRIPNSRSLVSKKEQLKANFKSITLISDVDYNKETLDFDKESLNYRVRNENLTRGLIPTLKKYVYLPGAKKETKLIIDNLPSDVKYFNYGRSDADEHKIYTLKNTDILHFATHGFFKDLNKNAMRINPLATCGIALNGANRTLEQLNNEINMNNHKNDGLLTGIEITSLNLEKTQLVTLSMCDSGLGRVYDGESINGLKKAFYMAGAKNIITTLWPISDNYTTTFMNDFYQELFKNGKVKDAFHVTQKQHLIKLKKQFSKSKNGIYQTVRLVGPFILN